MHRSFAHIFWNFSDLSLALALALLNPRGNHRITGWIVLEGTLNVIYPTFMTLKFLEIITCLQGPSTKGRKMSPAPGAGVYPCPCIPEVTGRWQWKGNQGSPCALLWHLHRGFICMCLAGKLHHHLVSVSDDTEPFCLGLFPRNCGG